MNSLQKRGNNTPDMLENENPKRGKTALRELDNNREPWQKQSWETAAWFKRFSDYKDAIGLRTLTTVFNDEAKERLRRQGIYRHEQLVPPRAWYNIVKAHRWEERCEAYDQHMIEQEAAIRAHRRSIDRDIRHNDREAARRKLRELLDAIDPRLHEIKPDALIKAVTILNQDARADLEDDHGQQAGSQNKGGVTFKDLIDLAQRFTPPAFPDGTNPASERIAGTLEGTPIDAKYRVIQAKQNERKSRKNLRKPGTPGPRGPAP